MTRPLKTKQRYFLRRAGQFFLLMMIPTLLLCLFSVYLSVKSTEAEINQKGSQTMAAAESNCELIISNVFTQNDLLTGSMRMSMALRHSLSEKSISYTDAIMLSSLRSVLDSVVNTHAYIDSIYIYLDDAPRYFASYRGLSDLETSPDLSWLPLYQEMDPGTKTMLCQRTGNYSQTMISFFRRLLMQNGCVVVNVVPSKLGNIMQTLLTREYEAITLLDKNGSILVSVSNEDGCSLSQADINRLLGMEDYTIGYQGWFRGEDQTYYINTGAYDEMMIVTSVSSKLMNKQAWSSIQGVLWMFLLNIVITLLLSYVTTRRSFAQIERMLDMFDSAEKGLPVAQPDKKVDDEYDMVMNNIIYMFLQENSLKMQLRENQLAKEHSELMALQLQINPHFLYNTLQTLQMEIRKGITSPIDTGEMVQRISDILRYALSNPQETVALEEEFRYLRKYAAVQQFRFGDRFIMYYEAEDGLEQTPVFRLMIQPLVENSLLHGMRCDGERMYIWAKAEREDGGVRITVSDTGVGMTEQEIGELLVRINDESSRSIGLTNLNRRLMLYYGPQSALRIQSEVGKGTEISFWIPAKQTPEAEGEEVSSHASSNNE